jgi:GTP-binding protein
VEDLAEFMLSAVLPTQFPSETLPEVAFLGRSNVGKSTLLNCIAGTRGLAFVSATPGRTQAVNFFRMGTKFILVDLPGYGHAKAPQEVSRQWGQVVDAYLEQRGSLKLCVFLLDARRGWMDKDLQLKEWLDHHDRTYIVVGTKVDKLNQKERVQSQRAIREHHPDGGLIWFSAVNGQGVKELWQAISKATGK